MDGFHYWSQEWVVYFMVSSKVSYHCTCTVCHRQLLTEVMNCYIHNRLFYLLLDKNRYERGSLIAKYTHILFTIVSFVCSYGCDVSGDCLIHMNARFSRLCVKETRPEG